MIDEQITLELFGYTSDSLSKGSHKLIVRVCDECGKINKISFFTFNIAKYPGLCQSCWKRNENNPMYGISVNHQKFRITLVCHQCSKKYKVKLLLKK